MTVLRDLVGYLQALQFQYGLTLDDVGTVKVQAALRLLQSLFTLVMFDTNLP